MSEPDQFPIRADIIDRWSNPATCPTFSPRLFGIRGRRSTQGDVLHVAGFTDAQILAMSRGQVDDHVMRLLGVTRFESILLNRVSGRCDGTELRVLTDLPALLGPHAPRVLTLMRHIETMDAPAWSRAFVASKSRIEAARCAIVDAVGSVQAPLWGVCHRAAWVASLDAVWGVFHEGAMPIAERQAVTEAAKHVASAVDEAIGADALRTAGRHPVFLPLFDFEPAD